MSIILIDAWSVFGFQLGTVKGMDGILLLGVDDVSGGVSKDEYILWAVDDVLFCIKDGFIYYNILQYNLRW